jgi:allophanate hydrolase subunit 1
MHTNGKFRTRLSCAAKSPVDETHSTLKSHLPEMTALFAALDAGYTPNFLDIMKAISEMVVFYTECDQIDVALEILQKKESQKNCRFCC